MRRCVASLAVALLLAAGGCSGSASEAFPPESTVVIGISEVGTTGLLGFEKPQEDSFWLEILPDADQNIYAIHAEYYLDDVLEGNEVLITEDGSWFGRENVILKAFSTRELESPDQIPPFRVHFVFEDASGKAHEAEEDYIIESPQIDGEYLVKITGSAASGYAVLDY